MTAEGRIGTRASEAGLDTAATAALLAPTVTLAERGLPMRMMAFKTLEGLAKGVPPARIETLLEALGARVADAARIVDPWLDGEVAGSVVAAGGPVSARAVRASVMESAATALFRGASEPLVLEILGGLPVAAAGRPIGVVELGAGLEIAADLPIAERDPVMTARIVVSALESGFDAAQMRELPAALRAARGRGGPPPPPPR